MIEDRVWSLAVHFRHASACDATAAAEAFSLLVVAEGLQLRRGEGALEGCAPGGGVGRAALGLLAGLRRAMPVYVGAGEQDEEGFAGVNRVGGLSIHVGMPVGATQARFHLEASGEVIRLIHWLADARRR